MITKIYSFKAYFQNTCDIKYNIKSKIKYDNKKYSLNDKSKILFSILHDEKYSLNNMEKHIILNDKNIFLIDSMLMIDINTTYIPK